LWHTEQAGLRKYLILFEILQGGAFFSNEPGGGPLREGLPLPAARQRKSWTRIPLD